MVKIEKESDNFVFEIMGFHKLWALKSSLTIPAAHIGSVYADQAKSSWVWGIENAWNTNTGSNHGRNIHCKSRL